MKSMATLAAFVAAVSFLGGTTTETGVVEARAAARQTARHSETRARGSALRPGDCIGIVAPASWMEREEWEKGVRLLKKRGYRVKLAPSCTAANGFFAGTDSARASDLNRFFADDEVKAILCLRGGYGSVRVLDKLNYTEIARHPKLLIGFSDITALHTALGKKRDCHRARAYARLAGQQQFDRVHGAGIFQGDFGRRAAGRAPDAEGSPDEGRRPR